MNHPPPKTTLDVLISEGDLQGFFSAIVADVISGNRELKLRVYTSTLVLQIMALAGRTDFDLFILLLNNIVFPTGNMPPDKRTKQALKFVAQLKARYHKLSLGFTDGQKGRPTGGVREWQGRISCSMCPRRAQG